MLERARGGRLVALRGPRPASEMLARVRSAGGFTQINHPTIFPSPPFPEGLCRGCPWEYSDASRPAAIMGDTVRGEPVDFTARVLGAGPSPRPPELPYTLLVVKDGRPFRTVPVTRDDFAYRFRSAGPGRYRLQLQRGTTIEALSSPIYVQRRMSGGGKPRGNGTDGDDVIVGTSGDDVIRCGSGRDRVDGGGGNDMIYCGSGDDMVIGGAGNDRLFGESGNDRIEGGSGDDALVGGSGKDRLDGGPGRDRLDGGSGRDVARQ